MAIQKINIGTNPDGSTRWHYWSDTDATVVLTGPITGKVMIADGYEYDVTEPVIEAWPGHELQISDAIGARYEAEGHPSHDAEVPFVHTPSDVIMDPAFDNTVHDPDLPNDPAGVLAHVTEA